MFLFPSAPDGVGTTKTGSPGAPAPPAGWPWQQCCVWTMGAVSCSCFLFPVSVSWFYSPERKLPPPSLQHTPSHLLLDAAPCLAVQGPVRPFITTSRHLGSYTVHHPITWPADLPLHCAIVLSLRGSTQWPRRERQHVLSLCNTADFQLQSAALAAPRPPRRRLRRMR